MDEQKTTGTLYIVATPIGNSRDMSERGREILSTADIIAAEDTRRSVVLLNKLGIRGNSLSANHKFNEYGKAKWFIEQLASGKDIAVITDAGTPCISDPGNELIRAAVENGIRVVGVPGCCAAVNALSISGFDLSSFLFYGFFPRETADRRRVLLMMRKGDTATYAFYESPKRIMSVIDFFIEENAQLRLCLCNDMTKLHEMTFRGTPQEVKDQLIAKETYEKGEYALIVEVCDDYRSSFLFYGFFPRETADRRRVLLMMRKGDTATYAFYESPKRIMSVIDFFIEENAQLRLCLCNDMTKLHEMTFRGTPQEVKDQLIAKETYEKGEYALIVEVCDDYRLREVEHITSPEALLVDCMVRSDCTAKDAIKMLLKDENNTYSKNELYAAHLALKERFGA